MSKQNNLFIINEEISEDLKEKFKTFLRCLPLGEKKIYLRIDSDGGNRWAAVKIIRFIYILEKEKGFEVITQCIKSGSAAMRIFSSGTIREVTKNSMGYIHLPRVKDLQKQIFLQKRAVEQFVGLSRQKLSSQEIIQLDLIPLSGNDMIANQLADKMVTNFVPNN